MAKFAQGTDVPPERSRAEIEGLVRKYGAGQFLSGYTQDRAMIGFAMYCRQVRFVITIPPLEDFALTPGGVKRALAAQKAAQEAEGRRRWRCLALSIKAKLEAVASEIVTFEEEFLAHIVLPNGATVAEHVQPQIREAYQTGQMPPLLPDFSGGDKPKPRPNS